jgi:hypothetical protein
MNGRGDIPINPEPGCQPITLSPETTKGRRPKAASLARSLSFLPGNKDGVI